VQTCSHFFKDRLINISMTSRVALLIFVINFALRLTIVQIMGYLSLNTRSEETELAMRVIFFAQLVNTILILIVTDTAIFKMGSWKIFSDVLGHPPPDQTDDYTIKWFLVDGRFLVKSMMLSAIEPLVEALVVVPFYKVCRWADRKYHPEGTLTAMPSIDAYIELYAGPVFLLNYRLA
jgi:hypothetical protein